MLWVLKNTVVAVHIVGRGKVLHCATVVVSKGKGIIHMQWVSRGIGTVYCSIELHSSWG